MTRNVHRPSYAALALFAAAAVPAFSQSTTATITNNVYVQHNLVSDIPGMADFTDAHLVNPWGLSESTGSPFWISNQGSATSTIYNGSGVASTTVVAIPSGATKQSLTGPTGQVQNSSTGFLLSNGKAASFIFATQDGTISAWNGGSVATVLVDNSSAGAVYTGLALYAAGPNLYAANFNSGKIEVFDTNFHATTVSGGFTDPNLPSGYAPYNIQNLGGKLYVTYALQNTNKNEPISAAGNGLVDVFDTSGNVLQRLVSNGPLNAPWGVAIAPSTFGAFGGALLVGNFGDGTINAFNLTTGSSLGALQNQSGSPIANSGLWALTFGNGKSGGDPNTLYFTAGIQGQVHGLLASIAPPAAVSSLSNGASGLAAASIAPGEVVLLNGGTIGPSPLVDGNLPTSGNSMATTLSTTTVTFNGTPAPILFASASQTAVVVPYEVAGSATANVVVAYRGQTTSAFSIPVAASAPGLFTSAENGSGEVVAFNQDGTVNGTSNPAARGSVVVLYATGDGVEDPAGQDGVISGDIIRTPMLTISATIGGQTAPVVFAGSAPGLLAGVLQVEVTAPAAAATGAVPVVLTIGAASSSQQSATIVLK
jgi:uncharacterized protein (TIGR03118 family)